jgi:hypothetical protein
MILAFRQPTTPQLSHWRSASLLSPHQATVPIVVPSDDSILRSEETLFVDSVRRTCLCYGIKSGLVVSNIELWRKAKISPRESTIQILDVDREDRR